MWKQLVESLEKDAEFFAPATPEQTYQVEEMLRVELPEELKSLLAESNGIFGSYGLGLIWPTQRISEDNLAFRRDFEPGDLYEEFDTLLFFADAGNGDQFAYKITDGRILTREIYAWNHEDDSRTVVAPSLKDYLEGWLQETIEI